MRKSAGILLYKKAEQNLFFFLVHPGGPFWKNKDAGSWTIPKGEFTDDEEPLAAAKREFFEETGHTVEGDFHQLNPVKQKAGKIVYAWAVNGDIDADRIVSNSFKTEWPYKSGNWITVPEIDKGGWFTVSEAGQKINAAQKAFIDEMVTWHNEKAV
ncbi:MAG TPA: NUDIX domain-containing protein [Flavisolibacter sp.]|nr:NUDIX domain-containing protein [Flavisolibacter sp.]